MKIAWFDENITPEVGCRLAGYGANDFSEMVLDDLHATGLCVDDGENRILLISFDLLGLDEGYIQMLRRECAEIIGTGENSVMLSCTHTHGGPQTRSRWLLFEDDIENVEYLEKLHGIIINAVKNLNDYKECVVGFASVNCDFNCNRRYVTSDNHATFLPHRREMRPLATQYADKELGVITFYSAVGRRPLYVIGNYAAHPLAGHSPGLGGLRISADFPGFYRDYIKSETGASSMYITGAAGDMVPIGDETGVDAARQMGVGLARRTMDAIIETQRNAPRMIMKDAKVGSSSRRVNVKFRNQFAAKSREQCGAVEVPESIDLEMQCVSIGDVCFVGVPGELCAELGQEIKWHSPFRKTFIAYGATAYLSYLCPGNFLVSGGYEAKSQRTTARTGLALVNTAVDAMYELREQIFPTEGSEPYPDCVDNLLVDIPLDPRVFK